MAGRFRSAHLAGPGSERSWCPGPRGRPVDPQCAGSERTPAQRNRPHRHPHRCRCRRPTSGSYPGPERPSLRRPNARSAMRPRAPTRMSRQSPQGSPHVTQTRAVCEGDGYGPTCWYSSPRTPKLTSPRRPRRSRQRSTPGFRKAPFPGPVDNVRGAAMTVCIHHPRRVNGAAARPGTPGPGRGRPGSDAPARRRGRP
jgi:hypothetical protein